MNKFRKIASFFLAFVMMFGTALHITAAEETGTITVTNTVKDATYTIYKIFDLESYDKANNRFSYKISPEFKAYVNAKGYNGNPETEGGEGSTRFIDIDDNDAVTVVEPFDEQKAQAFAQDIARYAKNERKSDSGSKKAAYDNETIVFGGEGEPGLDLGAYIVVSTMPNFDKDKNSLVSLTTTKPNASVVEKNETSDLEKVIVEDGQDYKTNDVNVGDPVDFKSTINVKGTLDKLVYHDTMSSGLTYGDLLRITIKRQVKNPSTEEGEPKTVEETVYVYDKDKNINLSDYYVYKTKNEQEPAHCTFEIDFSEAVKKGLIKSGDTIIIEYDAVLNENAVVAGAGNPNDAEIEFKNKWEDETHKDDSSTKTYTWQFNISKYTGEAETPLAGAEFALYPTADTSNDADRIKFIEEKTNVYVHKADGNVTTFTTDSTGKINLKGLDSGTYWLKEVTAPNGYNLLKEPIKVVISLNETNDGKVTTLSAKVYKDTAETDGTIKVENKTGTELPETGGIGTTMFYTVGGALVLGAAVLLITKKRAKAE